MSSASIPGENSLRARDLPATGQIRALDLTESPAHRPLWKPCLGSNQPPEALHALPRPGVASPMGFWFTESDEVSPDAPDAFTIVFESPSSFRSSPQPSEVVPIPMRRPEQTVRLKAPHAGDGDLILRIAPGRVQITCTDSSWKALGEPVLLAVGQYARFLALERDLDRLLAEARGDLGHATNPGLNTLRNRRRLTENARRVCELLLDLPHFEGPLSDPLAYSSTEVAAQTLLSLAEKLRLEGWSELIDQRAEAVEVVYTSITENLSAFTNYFWEVTLEALIVLILLTDLGLNLWELFGPE